MVPGMTLEEWAAGEAERLLSPLGDRWKHVRAVGERARGIGAILDQEDRTYLVAAAYLHDIGYAPDLQWTGLHQLDGARYVQSFGAERLACLIAHHSEARFEIRLRGFGNELAAYKREESWVSDALTYCDLTTSPTGQRMTFEDSGTERARSWMRCDRPHHTSWAPSPGQRTGCGNAGLSLDQAMTA
jgi:hypothetical protein